MTLRMKTRSTHTQTSYNPRHSDDTLGKRERRKNWLSRLRGKKWDLKYKLNSYEKLKITPDMKNFFYTFEFEDRDSYPLYLFPS